MSTKIYYKDFQIFKHDDIIVIKPITDTTLELRDILNLRKIARDLCNNNKQLILTDVRGQYVGITNRARKFMWKSQGQEDVQMAEAYITNSLSMKIVVNHYVNSGRSSNSAGAFGSEEDAIKWLRQVREN
jgi:predicted house-cleaning NTP pyrophosphatase (Maf/HAM1 superfamily)